MCNFLSNIPGDIITSLISVGGTIISVLIGIKFGFNNWKKQTRTQKEYESVIAFLESLTRYYNATKQVRNSSIPLSEFGPYIDSEENGHYKGIAHAYQKRWDKLVETEENMFDKKVVLELLIDSKIEENIEKLISLRQKIYINLEMLLENKRNGGVSKYDVGIIYGFFNNEDTFDKEIKEEIEQIKIKLKPYTLK